jgi:dolichyl-phosphate beta-glucosyltransferase
MILSTTLSVVVPSYKSAEELRAQLPRLLRWLKEKGIPHEVIVVDDGSDDRGATRAVADENGCNYIGLERNSGKGAAVRAGMRAAAGQYRMFTDADIPFELDAIDRFLVYLRDKEFDVVIGDRRLPESRYFSRITGARKLASDVFTFFVGRFVTTGFSDTQCGIKGFTAAAADDLFSVTSVRGFAFDVEVLYVALKRNYDIKRLPVHFRSTHDRSSVTLTRHAPEMLIDLFRIKWNHLRGRYAKLPRPGARQPPRPGSGQAL